MTDTEQLVLLATEIVEWIVVGGLAALAVYGAVREFMEKRRKGKKTA